MFKRIRANFLTGTLIVVPLVLTFWFLYFIIDKLNLLLLEPIANILGGWAPAENIEVVSKIFIFLLLLIGLTLIGFATRIIILRNIFGFGEKILYRLPMISNIYRTIKEISFAFFAQKTSIFQRVVLIEYPRKGIYQLGFVTSETKGEAQEKLGKKILNIFVPTTPNPTSGVLVLVPLEETITLCMSVAGAMKMVISGGTVVPKAHNGDTEDRSVTFKEKGSQGN
ncbi:MAG: DUF502 domain-containing protein [Candidatus Omnitrophica bacterium]|nr:DUF502 domain-containing protein [Candidatus Omnitrophota bacterium]MBU4589792.1 DUF502 domain-containing protein [Candidatus Omnitrophota bacterium]